MEYQELVNLLHKSINWQCKIRTQIWVVINNDSKTPMFKSGLCVYTYASYILVMKERNANERNNI